jgi:hypothetical protein
MVEAMRRKGDEDGADTWLRQASNEHSLLTALEQSAAYQDRGATHLC